MEFQIIAGDLCLDFINTLDNRPSPKDQKELVATYRDWLDWAFQAGAIRASERSVLLRQSEAQPQAAESARREAIQLRECLYRIVRNALRQRRQDAADLQLFNRSLGAALSHLGMRVGRSRFQLRWRDFGSRLDSPLWPIVKSASDLLTSADLEKVRECGADTCRWLFVDRSKNHSRRWCDMKVWGNRLKARRFYQRHLG